MPKPIDVITRMAVQQVLGMIPVPKLPDAFVTILPYLAELAQSDLVLSEETRLDIQVKITRLLRTAGLAGQDAQAS